MHIVQLRTQTLLSTASVSSFEAAEDEVTSYEASEPGPEAQLQREL
jgi:hypothetical protein